MEKQNKKIWIVLLLVLSACIINSMVVLGYVTRPSNPHYNVMFCVSIFYLIMSKILDTKKRYEASLVIGHIAFAFLCALLYYSKFIVDYATFIVNIYIVVCGIMETKRKNK